MNPSRLTITLLAIATTGLAWFAYHEHQQTDALQVSSQQKISSLEGKIAALESSAAAAQSSRLSPSLPSNPKDRAALKGPTPLAPNSPAQMSGPLSGGPAVPAVMNNPEMSKLVALQQRAVLDSRYAPLFRILKLSPDNLEKLKSLLVDKQTAAFDVRQAMQSQGINPRDGRDMMSELLNQAQAEADENIRKVLGDSSYTKFKVYEQTMPERTVVSQLEQRLSYSDHPLSTDQAERLIGVLAEISGKQSKQATGTPISPVSGPIAIPVISPEVLAQSQGLLDQDQMATLRQLQQEQEVRNHLAQQYRSAGGPVPGSASPFGPAPTAKP